MVAITGDDVENSNITQLTDTTDTTERGQPAIATDELESPSTAAGPCADVESGNADDVDCTDTDAHARVHPGVGVPGGRGCESSGSASDSTRQSWP